MGSDTDRLATYNFLLVVINDMDLSRTVSLRAGHGTQTSCGLQAVPFPAGCRKRRLNNALFFFSSSVCTQQWA